MRRTGAQSGFTLAELILVIVIVATLAALALPRMGALFPERRLASAALDLATVLRRSRQEAVVTVRRHLVYFDGAGRVYQVKVEEDPLGAPGEYEEPAGSLGGVFELPDGVTIESISAPTATSGGGHQIIFQSDGAADEASIVLVNERGERRTVAVSARRGEVTTE